MKNLLQDRVALVTGASSGIGEITAPALGSQGARVAIVARRKDRLDRLAAKLAGLDAEPLVLAADLGHERGAQRIVQETEKHFGRLDILIYTELRRHVAHAASQRAVNARAGEMRQLQADDVADTMVFWVTRPDHVCVNEVLLRPTDQER